MVPDKHHCLHYHTVIMPDNYLSDTSDAKTVQDSASKRLTVTLEDVGIQVSGEGENFASTCISVITGIFQLGRKKSPKRVGSL